MLASSIKQQQGGSLIEAMISMLLVAVLGLGVAYATSKSLVAQRYTTTQNLTVMHLREYLQTRDADDKTFSIAGQNLSVTETPQPSSLTVTVDGIATSSKTLPQAATGISLSVSNDDLFGSNGTIVVAHGNAAPSP